MTACVVCFNCNSSAEEQMHQISYWLDYLNSSLAFLLNDVNVSVDNSKVKFSVILAGLQCNFDSPDSPTAILLKDLQFKWPRLPLYLEELFLVNSGSGHSVQRLLSGIEKECTRLFFLQTIDIPTDWYQLAHSIQSHSYPQILSTQEDLFQLHNNGKSKDDFNRALNYLNAIGWVVCLPNGMVCTDPKVIPEIVAKFMSTEEVKQSTLKNKVDILNESNITWILQAEATQVEEKKDDNK